MMKVVIDNNIAIDLLKPNPQFEEEARAIFDLVGERDIIGYMGANSLTDIFYVLQKETGRNKARQTIKGLMEVVDIIDVTSAECATALDVPNPDFEDALVETCAKKVGADCVVSRDEASIKAAAGVEVIPPGELLRRINA